jgi:hypothetical protein
MNIKGINKKKIKRIINDLYEEYEDKNPQAQSIDKTP